MPQLLTEQNNSDNDIKIKTAYNGNIMITYVKENVTYEELCREIRGICRFSPEQVKPKCCKPFLEFEKIINFQVFTLKWVDEETDPCTMSSQTELTEAIRLYEVNRDTELVIHGKL